MNISERDKRALIALTVAAIVSLVVYFWPQGSTSAEVATAETSIPIAEQRLVSVRQLAAQVPAKEEQLKLLTADVEQWEGVLIDGETPQQAQAELLQILRSLATELQPSIEFQNTQIGRARPLGDSEHYGEVLVTVNFICSIEQLVNLLADIASRPEAIATDEIRITTRRADEKEILIRMTVAGMVPRQLVPQRRGLTSF